MTTHQDVLDTITGSMPTEWHIVTDGGLGPAYHDRFGRVTDGDGTNWLDHDAHYGQAVYREDVQLTIAWGMGLGEDDLTFDWAHFADPSISRRIVDVFWNGALIHRFVGLAVDGFRVTLPHPEMAVEGGSTVEYFTSEDLAAFRLFHTLTSGGYDFDDYVGRTGLEQR